MDFPRWFCLQFQLSTWNANRVLNQSLLEKKFTFYVLYFFYFETTFMVEHVGETFIGFPICFEDETICLRSLLIFELWVEFYLRKIFVVESESEGFPRCEKATVMSFVECLMLSIISKALAARKGIDVRGIKNDEGSRAFSRKINFSFFHDERSERNFAVSNNFCTTANVLT